GLDSVESLMIVGHTHVYLIENYFHCVDGNVVDMDDAPRELCDPYIQLIRPQVASRTKTRFPKLHASRSWPLASLSCISRRKFLLRDIGLEMFFCDGASILITCTSTKQRNAVHAALAGHCSGKGLDRELGAAFDISSAPLHTIQDASAAGAFLSSRLASAFLASAAVAAKLLDLTHKWRHGRLSNFFYLMAVNTMAGRTANDLSQYPVFPWVLADYDSEALDLDASASFRDLARPMGAQSDARAAQFCERYHALKSFGDAHAPPFHYGTHYSSAMIVASYLIRMRPFVLSYLLLQGGAFDHADRLFHSVRKAWRSASCDNTTDVRELTPEFFYLPEFLRNSNRFDLGTLHSGEPVDDVELPPWAHGSAHVFIARNRDALESTHVSRRLHLWIDLVFGCKQTGAEAEAALNVFHHLSYEGAINLDGIVDEVEKRAMIGMINNFGQTPLKLFLRPHPPRLVYNAPDRYLAGMDASLRRLELHAGTCSPHAVARLEYASGMWVGRAAGSCGDDSVLVWRPDASRAGRVFGTLFVGGAVHVNVHLAAVSAVLPVGDKRVLTAGVDGTIKCWDASAADARLVLQTVWRGHVHAVRALVHTRSFNVCISLDNHGGLVLWDVTRGRFVRQLVAPERVRVARTVSVSNDSGCVCVVAAVKYVNALTVYTLNGDALVRAAVEPGEVSSVAFAESRPSLVDAPPTDLLHVYWGSEFITVAYSLPRRVLRVYEMRCGAAGYAVRLAYTYDMTSLMQAAVTAMVVLKETDFDGEECLVRGRVSFVLGDARGHVYTY
ncbi:beach-domain-containing protein, partial [Metschnikowia bicuspidata]